MSQSYSPEVSDQELRRSYWFVTHYKKLKHLLIVGLGVGILALFSFSLWKTLDIYFFTAKETNALKQSLALSLGRVSPTASITDVLIEQVGSRSSQEGFENGYALLSNTNKHWYCHAQLIFTRDGNEVRSVPIFLAPEERHVFVGLGIPVGQPALSAVLKNVQWTFLSDDDKELLSQKSTLKVSDTVFLPSDKSGVSRLVPVSKLKFSITNTGIFDFWEVRLPILIKDHGAVIAVGETVLNSINAGEKKSAEVVWFTPISAADEFDIKPLIDIVDPSVIKKRVRQ